MPGNIFFTIRVLDAWNTGSLPATIIIINCGTLELFKNRIDCFFLTDLSASSFLLTDLLTYISSTIGCANFGPDWSLLFKVHEI